MSSGKKLSATSQRTQSDRERDLEVIAEKHLRGWTFREISEHISKIRLYDLSVSTIYKEMQIVRERWLNSALVNFDEAKARELARIDELETAAYRAWEKSWEDAESSEKEELIEEGVQGGRGRRPRIEEGENDAKFRRAREVVRRKGRLGLPAYLQVIQWCIDKRIKIYGLESPKEQIITWRDTVRDLGLNDEDVLASAKTIIEAELRDADDSES
jgi:hypothetical protein